MIVFNFIWFFLQVLYRTTSCHNVSGAPSYTHPIVGIVALQRDEGVLLTYWLEYHSKIVKLENILVLDNHSEAPETLNILESWATKGLKVMYYQGPYVKKGELTSQAFREILPQIDIIVPLDVDEFLFAFDGRQPIISKRKILSTLNDFWNQPNSSCLSLRQIYPNANLHGNETLETVDRFENEVLPLWFAKKIGKTKDGVHFDHGNHYAYFPCRSSHHHNCVRNCTSGYGQLGLLHYHYVNPEFVARRAIKDSVSFGYLPAGFTLEKAFAHKEMIQELANKSFDGHHKVKELWAYISKGPMSVLKPLNETFKVATLPEIVRKIESS
jgi:hypothetical protein